MKNTKILKFMDPSNSPQFSFPLLDIAQQKDNILKYLSYNSVPQVSNNIYDDLNLKELPIEDFNEYLKEMGQDGILDIKGMSGNRDILFLTDKGKRFLRAGGYLEECKDDINKGFKELLDKEKDEMKRDLEIENLRLGIKNNRGARIKTNIALIISGSTLVYLIVKDIILKLF